MKGMKLSHMLWKGAPTCRILLGSRVSCLSFLLDGKLCVGRMMPLSMSYSPEGPSAVFSKCSIDV